jgi:type IV pilus assembly protein PilA
MAILAASLAPALIRYIDKSRKSSDLTTSSAIKSAYETAITNDQAYSEVATLASTCDATNTVKVLLYTDKDGNVTYSTSEGYLKTEFEQNLSSKLKVKYTKNGQDHFVACVDKNCEMVVFIAKSGSNAPTSAASTVGTYWKVQPEVDNESYE